MPVNQPRDYSPPTQVDEYRLIRPLGRGGMGQVYLAHDKYLDRLVALKFAVWLNEDLRERLTIEARAIARLNHRNIVHIHRISSINGVPYLVYEYVLGETLDKKPLPLPTEQLTAIARDVARGLSAVHACGLLHRDIKPGNVILTEQGEAKLLDFGLAKNAGAELDAPVKSSPAINVKQPAQDKYKTLNLSEPPADEGTQGGEQGRPLRATEDSFLGSPCYMAAELWQGKPATKQTDIYAFGTLLFELASGQRPYDGETIDELMRAIQKGDAPPVRTLAPDVAPGLAIIVDRCLHIDPAKRFASAWELYDALVQLETQEVPDEFGEGNPFPGLVPFQRKHRGLFFGRKGPIGSITGRLTCEPMLLVTGDSGVGKSSLCRAGVLPLIQQNHLGDGRTWEVVELSPGRYPLRNLASALALVLQTDADSITLQIRKEPEEFGYTLQQKLGKSRGLLIFIDQLEELVTQSDSDEAHSIGRLLGELGEFLPGLRVLMTVRNDFLGRLAEVSEQANVLSNAVFILQPLSANELREIIVEPARAKGVSFESDEMVKTLVDTTLGSAGGLPLLQFTLAALWEARNADGAVIPATALDELGGVAGALATHADRVLDGLSADAGRAAKRILMQLVTAQGTRMSRSPSELISGSEAAMTAWNQLVASRLLVVRDTGGDGTVCELAHEALITGWSRLRDWLSGDSERHQISQNIEAARVAWEQAHKATDMLLSDRRIAEAERVGIQVDQLSAASGWFFAESRKYANRRRRLRRLFGLALIIVPMVVVLVFGWLWQSSAAMADAQKAVDALNLAKVPGRERDALVASIKLVAGGLGGTKQPPNLAVAALTEAVMTGGEIQPPMLHQGRALTLTLSAQGERAVTGSDDGTAKVWELASGHEIATLKAHSSAISTVAFDPSGRSLVTGGSDGKIFVWDAASYTLRGEIRGHSADIHTITFSPDETRLLTVSGDGTARLWRMPEGQPVKVFGQSGPRVYGARFSPDGKSLVTADDDGIARLFDGHSAASQAEFKGHTGAVVKVLFSNDGKLLATASRDQTVRLFDVASTQATAVLTEHGGTVHTLAFSPDSNRMIINGGDRISAQLWDVGRQARIASLSGHSAPTLSAAFSSDGTRIVTTGSTDKDVRLFDGFTGSPIANFKGHSDKVTTALFTPDGRRVVTAGPDGSVRLWSGYPGRALATLSGHTDKVWSAQFSPDGQHMVSGSGDHTARIWDIAQQKELFPLSGHQDVVYEARYSQDGSHVITASWDKTARIWNARTGESVAVLVGHEDKVDVAVLSPSGSLAATAAWDGTVRIWDARTGKLLLKMNGHQASGLHRSANQPHTGANENQPVRKDHNRITALSFSPDGSQLVSAGWDGTARVWDTRTGAELLLLEDRDDHDQVWLALFSPDGNAIITTGQSHAARLWDTATGRLKRVLTGHANTVNSAAFSADGKRVATASLDCTAIIWDVETGARLTQMIGHTDSVWFVNFSPDGKRVVTASSDHTARLWDAPTGEPLGTLRGHTAALSAASFSPDGKLVLTSSIDYTAKLFPATAEKIFSMGCSRLRPWDAFAEVRDLCEKYVQ
ncbi:MAG: protein kinase [Polyangia bacterium]